LPCWPPSAHRPRGAPTRSSVRNEPQVNVDHFYHRPVYHVVGLLTDKLQRHHVHDVGYFGPGTFEQFPHVDTD
jgi:hypothetical protein